MDCLRPYWFVCLPWSWKSDRKATLPRIRHSGNSEIRHSGNSEIRHRENSWIRTVEIEEYVTVDWDKYFRWIDEDFTWRTTCRSIFRCATVNNLPLSPLYGDPENLLLVLTILCFWSILETWKLITKTVSLIPMDIYIISRMSISFAKFSEG